MRLIRPIGLIICAVAGLFAAGCATNTNPAVGPAIVSAAVATGVGLGAAQKPEIVPYLRAADQVVCAAANQTNISPVALTAAIEASPSASVLKTTEGTLVLNFALSAYMILWDQYGGDLKNAATLQSYLQATCDGITLGLPGSTNAVSIARRPRVR